MMQYITLILRPSPSLKCINITFTYRILHITILVTHNFKIEERRRRVATLLAQSMTETEIAGGYDYHG